MPREFEGFYFSSAVTASEFAEFLEAQMPVVAQEEIIFKRFG
jgi:hypothetical protein